MAGILLTADAPGLFALFGQPQWGIFDAQSGAPILQADAVYSVEYARDYHISDFPQENGAFASYNKVQVPFQAKVSFLANQLRFNFLAQAEPAVASLGLVTVVMPEFSYPSANLTHYGFQRTARSGKTLILFDVWCEEVRILPSATSASTTQSAATQSPNGASAGAQQAASQVGLQTGPQSTNGATATQSGQVQPQPTQPTSQGGPTAGSSPTTDGADISYSTVPSGTFFPGGANSTAGQTPAQILGTQNSISTGSGNDAPPSAGTASP